MENAAVQKEQVAGPSIAAAMWDPFWFMRALFGWARPAEPPSPFKVKETNDTYVCTVNAKLTLPDQADAAHVTAELNDDGELTLLVPKVAAATPEPKTGRTGINTRRGSAGRKHRRGARTREPRR